VLRAHIDPAIGGKPIGVIRREDIKALWTAGSPGRRPNAAGSVKSTVTSASPNSANLATRPTANPGNDSRRWDCCL
jgi:hypothetical protein